MEESIRIRGVNHVALRVRDLEASAAFYKTTLGFTEDIERFAGVIAMLRAPHSTNHHDLALLQIGPDAEDDNPRAVGMWHFAFEVESMDDLVTARERLAAAGCLDKETDHGATKAVYGRDPDDNTFELTWVLPREEWGDWGSAAPIAEQMDTRDEAQRRHEVAVTGV